MYEYEAHLVRVIDGDTVELRVDVGFHTYVQKKFRVLGVDTPELRGGTEETKAKAREARDYVIKKLVNAVGLVVRTQKPDSFGRWLADIEIQMETYKESLAEALIDAGLGERVER